MIVSPSARYIKATVELRAGLGWRAYYVTQWRVVE